MSAKAEASVEGEGEEPFEIPYSKSTFMQQTMAACKPFLSPLAAALVYAVFAVVSLAIGLVYYLEAEKMHEVVFEYTDLESNVPHSIRFPNDMDGDIFVYYELTNFYQNNYLYSDSKSWEQWFGDEFQSADVDKCDPVRTGEGGKTYAPCGAVSLSIFNDTFRLSGGFPNIIEDGIAPKCYKDLIKPLPASWTTENSIFTLDETLFPGNQGNDHFISWALVAPFSTFRKVWGKVDAQHIDAGDYQIEINNIFPTSSFGGKKRLIFSEVNWMGARNRFIGIFFIVICALSGAAAIIFVVLHFTHALPLYRAILNEQTAAGIDLLP